MIIRKWLVCACAALGLTGLSLAQEAETPTCPDTAEQALYNMWARVQLGQETSADNVFRLARAGIYNCQDRSDVQGLAIELLLILGDAIESPEQKLAIYKEALQAVSFNDTGWNASVPAPEIITTAGTPEKLYFYGQVNSHHKSKIIPSLLKLAEQGEIAMIFLDPEFSACPYEQTKQERALTEAQAIVRYQDFEAFGRVEFFVKRIRALSEACPQRRSQILNALSNFYKRGHERTDLVNGQLGQSYLRLAIEVGDEILALPDDPADNDRDIVVSLLQEWLPKWREDLR